MAISFRLEVFEGPLDLLLHLISKHKLNINDIPIITLVEQYLEYISDMAEQDMDVAGEFLEMAAKLIYIKTVSLLPKKEEAEVLKKELEGRLIEYSLCKLTAQKLSEKWIGDAYSVKKPMKIEIKTEYKHQHSVSQLVDAWNNMNTKKDKQPPELKPSAFSKLVSRKFVSVSSRIVTILKTLYTDGKCSFSGLFEEITDRSERVATFLAVLELTKSGRIILNDDNTEITFNTERTASEDEEFKAEFDETESGVLETD